MPGGRVLVCAVGGDRTWAEWVRAVLRELGYAAERQNWRFVAGEDLDRHRDALLAGGDRIVLIYSPLSVRSPYYSGGWAQRLLQDPAGRERTLVVQVDGASAPVPVDSTIRRSDSHAEALAGLAAGLSRRDWPHEELPGPDTVGAAYPGRGPGVNNLPPRNPDFTGRIASLDTMADWLLRDGPQVGGCVLLGMSGVGKSQTALEYAHRYRCHYDLVWRVIAEEPSTISSDLTSLAHQLGVLDTESPQAMLVGLRQKLAELDRWLVIFDNAVDRDVLHRYWPGEDGHVLITSNRNLGWRNLALRELRLDVLDAEDSVTFLRKRFDWRAEAETESEIRAIARELGHLPLALDQAAGYVASTRCSLHEYLELLRRRLPEMLAVDVDESRREQSTTIAATLGLALGHVREHSPAAEQLLVACSFLAPDGIPRSLFSDNASAFSTSLGAVAADPLAYGRVVEVLRRYSLLDVDEHTLTVHRLVQTVARDRMEHERPDEFRSLAAEVIRVVAALFPADPLDVRAYPECTRWLPHAMAVRHFHHFGVAQGELASLLLRCGAHLAEGQQERQALDLLDRAHRMLGDKPTTALAELLTASGQAHFGLAELPDARDRTERALQIMTDLHGGDSFEALNPLLRLTGIVMEQADLDGAHGLATRALSVALATQGDGTPLVWKAQLGLGTVNWRQGRITKALDLYVSALATIEVDDLEGASAAHAHELVAMVALELGAVNVARRHQEKARDLLVRRFGHRSMAVARNRVGLARIMLHDGQSREAEAEAVEGVEGLERWQADHPNTATGFNVLGDVLRALGRTGEAMSLHRRAWEIFTRTYGPDHPYNAEALRRLGEDHYQAGQFPEAEEALEAALRILVERYGVDYPRAAPALLDLAALSRAQGRAEQADRLSERAGRLRELARRR
ncbi:FxSxx-COOH system tetratricopeptide repeat protein [Actinosynnema sp. NPDC023587]|uniref:FxSxx-COOH system tetratricopeptide repeat protein n=1 Tax=Actinosynnema sp. NPDC023587 TaxID=3154695 RepID=UPI0033F176E6